MIDLARMQALWIGSGRRSAYILMRSLGCAKNWTEDSSMNFHLRKCGEINDGEREQLALDR